jgi:protoporphyrin/coproporphyrin ferrochelatase
MQVAVLMMAYGGPNSLDDVEAYLLDVRGGRATPPALVDEFRQRYALIGGRSPLLDITRAQAAALECRLSGDRLPLGEGQISGAATGQDSAGRKDQESRETTARAAGTAPGQSPGQATTSTVETSAAGLPFRVYVGMRHWYPYVGEAVMQMVRDQIHQVVAICMAPHYSRMSTGAYFQKLEQAREALRSDLEVIRIEDWHSHPLLIQALAERVQAALERFAPEERTQVTYLFTAHSLPAVLKEQGDPYDTQLHETAALLADRLGLRPEQWGFAYQSAAAAAGQWLGPAVEDVIVQLADAGRRAILVAPIGFVADHVEILYDIDIECRQIAQEHGVHLERTESLNTSPTFIDALADIVRSALERQSARQAGRPPLDGQGPQL